MIKVATALRTILDGIKILDSEVIKLTDVLERVLAEDIHSDSDIPGFDNSAMDGYAVKTVDLKGASKKILKNNQAIRIMTGAVMPKGADSVVMVEDTQRGKKNKVNIFKLGMGKDV